VPLAYCGCQQADWRCVSQVTDRHVAARQADTSNQASRKWAIMTSLRRLGNVTGRKPMSQYRSAYRPQPTRNTRLKSLATKTAVAALLITGSAGIVVVATSSSAHPTASASQPVQPAAGEISVVSLPTNGEEAHFASGGWPSSLVGGGTR
jgi:hypothetical protein